MRSLHKWKSCVFFTNDLKYFHIDVLVNAVIEINCYTVSFQGDGICFQLVASSGNNRWTQLQKSLSAAHISSFQIDICQSSTLLQLIKFMELQTLSQAFI